MSNKAYRGKRRRRPTVIPYYYDPERPKCDFCLSREYRWDIRTNKFHLPATPTGLPEYLDDGSWLACDECKDLVEREEWEKIFAIGWLHQLVEHTNRKLPPFDMQYTQAWRRRIFEAFKANRTGEVVPFG